MGAPPCTPRDPGPHLERTYPSGICLCRLPEARSQIRPLGFQGHSAHAVPLSPGLSESQRQAILLSPRTNQTHLTPTRQHKNHRERPTKMREVWSTPANELLERPHVEDGGGGEGGACTEWLNSCSTASYAGSQGTPVYWCCDAFTRTRLP